MVVLFVRFYVFSPVILLPMLAGLALFTVFGAARFEMPAGAGGVAPGPHVQSVQPRPRPVDAVAVALAASLYWWTLVALELVILFDD
jgi:hypothetical protein